MRGTANSPFSDGFQIGDLEQFIGIAINAAIEHPATFSPLSMRIAIDAYLNVADVVHWRSPERGWHKQYTANAVPRYTYEYLQLYSTMIVFFQHSVELELKDVLSRRHPLLACIRPNAASLDKLLRGEALTQEEELGLRTSDFLEALVAFCDLFKQGKLSNDYAFLYEAEPWLKKLNKLRNRLLHKGTFILTYQALDLLAGKYMLPFAVAASRLNSWATLDTLSNYRALYCEIDPIELLINHFTRTSDSYDIVYVMLLKEMARSANRRPYWALDVRQSGPPQRPDSLLDYEFTKAEMYARLEALNVRNHPCYHTQLSVCPICGQNTLVVKYIHEDTDGDEGGYFLIASDTICACCGFSPNPNQYKNPKHYALEIADIWDETSLFSSDD